MFPEYRDLISKLKSSDVHFQKKFDLHNDLDAEINLSCQPGPTPGFLLAAPRRGNGHFPWHRKTKRANGPLCLTCFIP